MPPDAPVYLVRGDDPSLVAQASHSLVDRLVGDRDPALVVEEHGGPSAEPLEVGPVLDACITPPFLVDRRVVVVRDAGRMAAADASRVVDYLKDPLASTVLVLVGGGGTVPQSLSRAVTRAGQVVETAVRPGRDQRSWVQERVRSGPVRLDAAAGTRLAEHVGEDLGRVQGLLQTLAAAYGEGATVGAGELEPFLGEAGSVPSWDLTDAVDAGSAASAIGLLHRMLGAGGYAVPQLVAVLHRHFANLLALDGADVVGPEDAAALLGARSTFVAKKALAQSRRLGSERIGQAVTLIADADLDTKGRTGLAPEVVLEVLVARLARLAPTRRSGARR